MLQVKVIKFWSVFEDLGKDCAGCRFKGQGAIQPYLRNLPQALTYKNIFFAYIRPQ